MSDNQLFFLVFIAPWLTALVAGGLIAQAFSIRAELARLRSLRVIARREVNR